MKTRLSIFTSIISLLILVATIFVVFNIFSFSSRLKERVEIAVYLKSSADTVAIKNEIAAIREVKRVRFISKEEALKAFKRGMGKDEDIFSVLQTNPLPDSFRVRIKPELCTIGGFEKVCAEIKSLSGVDDVSYEKEFLNKLLRVLKIMELAVLTGVVIIAGFTILVLFTIRRLKVDR